MLQIRPLCFPVACWPLANTNSSIPSSFSSRLPGRPKAQKISWQGLMSFWMNCPSYPRANGTRLLEFLRQNVYLHCRRGQCWGWEKKAQIKFGNSEEINISKNWWRWPRPKHWTFAPEDSWLVQICADRAIAEGLASPSCIVGDSESPSKTVHPLLGGCTSHNIVAFIPCCWKKMQLLLNGLGPRYLQDRLR